jgi:diguanylate cyclase (GGDEF)-like protein/PAS domain S-box-containing protein
VAGEQQYEGLAEVLDALPDRVVRYRLPELTIVYCNAAWAGWYGLTPDQVLGRALTEFLSLDGKVGLETQLARLNSDHPILADSVAREDPNHPDRWVEWNDRYLDGPDGPEILAVGRDVTDRHLAEIRLTESETRFRDLADKATDVLWHFRGEPYPHLDYMSPSVENLVGYPPEFFINDFDNFLAILQPEDRELVEQALAGGTMPDRVDLHYRHANGSIVISEVRMREVAGGLQGVARDVTELRRLQDSLSQLALRDPLTGLANRRLFAELLDADLARTQRGGQPLALAYIDLDDFKHINDSYGHEAGDIVLCETARRLEKVLRGADVVARLGGDEFVVVYEPTDLTSERIVARLEEALARPIQIGPSLAVYCPPSIGVADTRAVGYDAGRLLAVADAAMYEVKRRHHGTRPAGRVIITPMSAQRPTIVRDSFDSSHL